MALVAQLTSKRDPYDHHASRVADLAVKMARLLDLPEEQVGLIEVGAHLHDMGKLLVRDDVLNVPRKVTKAEFAMIKVHTSEGYKIARDLGYAPIIQDIILHHHENWDGTGYPDRLKGATISLPARIVHVVDAFDAMTSQRPYRKPLIFAFVRAELEKHAGAMFDPQLVDLFFKKAVRE